MGRSRWTILTIVAQVVGFLAKLHLLDYARFCFYAPRPSEMGFLKTIYEYI